MVRNDETVGNELVGANSIRPCCLKECQKFHEFYYGTHKNFLG